MPKNLKRIDELAEVQKRVDVEIEVINRMIKEDHAERSAHFACMVAIRFRLTEVRNAIEAAQIFFQS